MLRRSSRLTETTLHAAKVASLRELWLRLEAATHGLLLRLLLEHLLLRVLWLLELLLSRCSTHLLAAHHVTHGVRLEWLLLLLLLRLLLCTEGISLETTTLTLRRLLRLECAGTAEVLDRLAVGAELNTVQCSILVVGRVRISLIHLVQVLDVDSLLRHVGAGTLSSGRTTC